MLRSGLWSAGSAAAGRAGGIPRGRPEAANLYPIFPCADGKVRICLPSKRQWRGMFGWLGEPAEFASPEYDSIPARFRAAGRLYPLIGELFAGSTRRELMREGERRGVPISGVFELDDVLELPHFLETGALADLPLTENLPARLPIGPIELDVHRAGFRYGPQKADPSQPWQTTEPKPSEPRRAESQPSRPRQVEAQPSRPRQAEPKPSRPRQAEPGSEGGVRVRKGAGAGRALGVGAARSRPVAGGALSG